MKNENFDADLSNHIKQIFENHDDGQANTGWDLLREKYPEKRQRKYFFWWIAAAVFLLAGLSLWLFQTQTGKVKPVKSIKQAKSYSEKTQVKTEHIFRPLISKTDSFHTKTNKKSMLKTASALHSNYQSAQNKLVIADQNHNNTKPVYPNHAVFTDKKLELADSTNHINSQSNAKTLDTTTIAEKPKTIEIQHPSIKPLTKKDVVKTASVKKAISKVSRFGFSIYAGPHVNFATGSSTLLGFGAGISADLKLNNKLKLASGLGLIRNKLSYQNNLNNNSYASIPAYQSSAGNVITNSTTLNSLNASLLQLDVPINLVYQILPGKNSISILAGLTSGTFAKETYNYQYTNTVNNVEITKSFQSFYLFKTLNMAAQFSLPIKKYNLQVEPFVKVPLGYSGTQQLKFGATGINLKFNFKP